MLAEENRLKKKKDFEKVFKQGKSFRSEFLSAREAKNGLDASRFGFAVSLKVSKKAVARNKIRRRMREIVKKNISSFKKGRDIILIARPGLEKKDFAGTEEVLEDFFKKSGLTGN